MPRRSPKVIRPVDPREDAALDAALAASFPASDPVAILEPASADAPLRSRSDGRRADIGSPVPSRKKDLPL